MKRCDIVKRHFWYDCRYTIICLPSSRHTFCMAHDAYAKPYDGHYTVWSIRLDYSFIYNNTFVLVQYKRKLSCKSFKKWGSGMQLIQILYAHLQHLIICSVPLSKKESTKLIL